MAYSFFIDHMKMNAHKSGIVGATMLGGLHVLWSVFVLLGWAQGLVNFSSWAHMLKTAPVHVGSFDGTAAVTVIVVAAGIGYCIGYAFAVVHNKVYR